MNSAPYEATDKTFIPSEHEASILREFKPNCPICGWSDCECQTVVANCNTCGAPIFGREDYDKRYVQGSAPYRLSIYTCEVCHEEAAEKRRAQEAA